MLELFTKTIRLCQHRRWFLLHRCFYRKWSLIRYIPDHFFGYQEVVTALLLQLQRRPDHHDGVDHLVLHAVPHLALHQIHLAKNSLDFSIREGQSEELQRKVGQLRLNQYNTNLFRWCGALCIRSFSDFPEKQPNSKWWFIEPTYFFCLNSS